MCGIVGAISLGNSAFQITENYITRMRDTMRHRGPDGAGTWVSADGKVGLGHRRLAIIDLSNAAAQPMCNRDRSLWITFNGEIYNHAEIRRELEHKGHRVWKTDHSDTEVVLRAFEEWGIDCLKRFRGMFAFAIWDDRKRELWLARDRIGIKPLYYSMHNQRVTFASEIKALLQDPQQRRAVNEEAMYHFLSFSTAPAPLTMFEGIHKLPAANWMRLSSDGSVQQSEYWNVLNHVNPLTTESEEDVAERLLDSLKTSVGYRKVGDVPVGVFLSGGIDSSTNAALFSGNADQPLRTFTTAYDSEYESNPSEIPYARQVANQFNAEHHEVILSENDLLGFLPKLVELQDEPIADPVCIPVYFLSKLARDNGTVVCQVGEGADELFCGYPGWRRLLTLQKRLSGPFSSVLTRAGMWGLDKLGKRGGWPWERLQRASRGQAISWGGGGEAFSEWEKQQLLSPQLQNRFRDFSTWSVLEPLRKEFLQADWEKTDLGLMTYLDLKIRLPDSLLMRVDKMSMGVGLEARVPFLDHHVIELAMSIPSRMKLKNGNLKHILKKAVRGVIPDNIIDRKKQGFGVPVHEWLHGQLGGTIRKELNEFCQNSGLLNAPMVNQIIDRGGQSAWYLFNFALWWKRFIANEEIGNLETETTSLQRAA